MIYWEHPGKVMGHASQISSLFCLKVFIWQIACLLGCEEVIRNVINQIRAYFGFFRQMNQSSILQKQTVLEFLTVTFKIQNE